MSAVPWMLVGCGLMGARHLRGYAELERVAPGQLELVAVCDAERARAEALADEAAARLGRRPQVYDTLDSAVANLPSGAAADVVTPNRSHDSVVVGLLEAGVAVLVEKPLAVTVARGRRMVDTARRCGVALGVAENNRRDPMNRLLHHAVSAGLLGELTFVQQVSVARGGRVVGTPWRHRLAMGGLALDVWIHLGYTLEYLAGPIDTVYAQAALVEPERPGAEGRAVACDAVDAIAATLRFADGALGSWSTHFASSGWTRTERVLIGTRASAIASPDRSGRGVVIERGAERLEGEALLAELPDFALAGVEASLFGERPARYELPSEATDAKLIAAEVADFVDAVRQGREPEVPGEVGLRSVAIPLALLEAAEAGRPVSIASVLAGEVDAAQRGVEAQAI